MLSYLLCVLSGREMDPRQNRKEQKMRTFFHATNKDSQTLHDGICFTNNSEDCEFYGSNVFEVELDWDAYKVADMDLVERNDGDDCWIWRESETGLEIRTMANEWPGDCADTAKALIDAGFDACMYYDWDVTGEEYTCYRLLKLRAEDAGREMTAA